MMREADSREGRGFMWDYVGIALMLAPLVISPVIGALALYIGVRRMTLPAIRVSGIAYVLMGVTLLGAGVFFWSGLGK